MSDQYNEIFNELKPLYSRMDQSYGMIADAYGFHCFGCTDNCCLTRFFHHTLLEFLYLRKGFAELDEAVQKAIRIRAAEVNGEVKQAEDNGNIPSVMCPLNIKGICVLYAFRPMICRLHGIPYEFSHPLKNKIYEGPGCHEFDARCGQRGYVVFNRTPLYEQMALLEQRLREKIGTRKKFKKTVAQMLIEDMETVL